MTNWAPLKTFEARETTYRGEDGKIIFTDRAWGGETWFIVKGAERQKVRNEEHALAMCVYRNGH